MAEVTATPKSFTYFCVVDFEATCFESESRNNLGKPYEIIEFPSVLFKARSTASESDPGSCEEDFKELKYVAEFRRYCKPVVNPILSTFCTQLTGIQQSTVDAATIFPNVLHEHLEWLKAQTDGHLEDVIMLSCGVWDFDYALRAELARWSRCYQLFVQEPTLYDFIMRLAPVYSSFINVKDLYTALLGDKAGGMATMLKNLQLELQGRHHSGLDDAKNIGRILQQLYTMRDPAEICKMLKVRKCVPYHKDQRQMWRHCKKQIALEKYPF